MSAYRFTRLNNDDSWFRILHGSDSDVTWITIVAYSNDCFVVTRTFDNEFTMKLEPTVEVWNHGEMKHEFDSQYGSPMHYMGQEDFDWITYKDRKNGN